MRPQISFGCIILWVCRPQRRRHSQSVDTRVLTVNLHYDTDLSGC